ncbi:MAG: hypothetical protein F6K19_17125 [Cyanothece sp. SIO1E1]|nr:hypothetical protein [Cyanothece sp. SIO1E1]
MPDSRSASQKSDPALTKLLDVDSALATQAAELTAQLTAIQGQRDSLKTVINMFASTNVLGAELTSAMDASQLAVEDVTMPPLEPTATTNGTQPKAKTKQKSPAPAKNKAIKTDPKSLNWQGYVRAEFSSTSLPDVVESILQRQPNDVFQIPAVVNAIFVTRMPKEAQGRARDRVSNILAEGARKKRWYRGKLGCYSMSKKAVART